MVGGPCDFSVSPSPFGLDFGTLDYGTSDLGLTIRDRQKQICFAALAALHPPPSSLLQMHFYCIMEVMKTKLENFISLHKITLRHGI